MKTKLLALLYFFFPLANHDVQNISHESRRLTMNAYTPDSARASLIVEEFNGRGY